MKISEDGKIVTWSVNDVFLRQLIVFHEKLLDEQANNWFRKYCQKVRPDKTALKAAELEPKHKYICNHLKKKYGFEERDFGVWLMQAQSKEWGNFGNDKEMTNYTIVDDGRGLKVIFNQYNGYWYTATETGKEQELVLFDYGDFYCMGAIFPLATYFVMRAKEYGENGK